MGRFMTLIVGAAVGILLGVVGVAAAMAALNRASMENVTFVPTGFFLGYQAWRKGVGGVVKAPFPQFWGVQKT